MSLRQAFAGLCCIVMGAMTLHRLMLLESCIFLAAACVIVAMPASTKGASK